MIVNVGGVCSDTAVVETDDVYDVTVSCDAYGVTIGAYQASSTAVAGFDFSTADNSGYVALTGGI